MTAKKKAVFGVQEWADESCNCCLGCSNDCHYCYAKGEAVRYKRKTAENWFIEEINMTKVHKICGKKPCKVMFPAHHDITPGTLRECIKSIDLLLMAGHQLLIVSKPHIVCIATIVDRYAGQKKQILFRFTIGSADQDILRFWEPHAPSFEERFLALQYAHLKGYETSISCEPMLDGAVTTLIQKVSPFVTDAIWLGLPNFLQQRLSLNGAPHEVKEEGRRLMQVLNNDYILNLYQHHKDDSMIKWKESIKKIVGIDVATETGLDV